MASAETVLAAVILTALTIYSLSGGADFGGGVWDLLASGPQASRQREIIAHAIAPIWEVNHVWLILVIVLLFVAFPIAFAAISTALHIPLTLMLLGIVMRGSAFAFRTYSSPRDPMQSHWGRIFAIASIVTPIMLGICVGAIASGRIRVDRASGQVTGDFFSSWLKPFPLAVGALTLALFAFLAAVYLTLETRDRTLQHAFRLRALLAAIAVGVTAAAALALAAHGAPRIGDGLMRRWWSIPFQAMTAAAATGALFALWRGRYALARGFATAQVTLILWGWGLAQYPFIVEPDLTFQNAAAPPRVLGLLIGALFLGAIPLSLALVFLFRVFKFRSPPA